MQKVGGNLLPKNIEPFIAKLSDAERIIVLTDLENEPSVNDVKNRIIHDSVNVVFVAVKALEAWYLADTESMKKLFDDLTFFENSPENTTVMPYEYLKDLVKQRGLRRGLGSKPLLAKKMVKNYHFSIENAAKHPNCFSAKEFINYW